MSDDRLNRDDAVLAWQTLLALRNEDLRLVWTRSSVLIALHAGLFAVHAAIVDAGEPTWGVVGVDLAGLILALTWARIAYSGVYYQRYWQSEMAEIEVDVFNEFRIWGKLQDRVRNEPHGWVNKRLEDIRWIKRRWGEDPEDRSGRMPELGGLRYRSMGWATISLPWLVGTAWVVTLVVTAA